MALPFGNPFNPQQQQNMNQQPQGQQQQQPQNNQNTNLNNNNGQQNQSGIYPGSNNQPQNGNQQQNNNQQQNQQSPQGGSDPLMDFTRLWNNDNNGNQENNQQQQQKKGYVPEFQPEQLNAAISRLDFTKDVMTPELQQAIVGGGEGAVAAMMQVINKTMQNATTVNFAANRNLIERSLTAAEAGFLEKVPANVRDVMTKNSIQSSNPLMNDPNYSGMVDFIREKAQAAHPKATPDQIQRVVNRYFDDMHAKMTGNRQQQQELQNPQDNNTKLKVGDPNANWTEWVQDGQEDLMQSLFQNDGTQNYQPPQNQQGVPNQNQFQQNQGSQQQQGTYTFT